MYYNLGGVLMEKKTWFKGIVSITTAVLPAIITGFFTYNAGRASMEEDIKIDINNGVNNEVSQVVKIDNGDYAGIINKLYAENQSLSNDLNKVNDKYNEINDTVQEMDIILNERDELLQKISHLERELESFPLIKLYNAGLVIDGRTYNIKSNNSLIEYNNILYYSFDIIKEVAGKNKQVSFEENNVYIGERIYNDKANLVEQWVVDSDNVRVEAGITDSYGNYQTNALFMIYYDSCIIYNLDKKYNKLEFSVAMWENCDMDKSGVITVLADDVIVYTSPKLSKTTEPFSTGEIDIKAATLLTIKYSSPTQYNKCFIYDAVIYN